MTIKKEQYERSIPWVGLQDADCGPTVLAEWFQQADCCAAAWDWSSWASKLQQGDQAELVSHNEMRNWASKLQDDDKAEL